MAISRINPDAAASSGNFSKVCTVPTSGSGVNYKFLGNFDSGIYSVSCISTSIVSVKFYSGSTLVGSGTTSSGVLSVNISSSADTVVLRSNTGSNILVSIEKTGEPLDSGLLGVIDSITTTSSYTCPSAIKAVACVIGGGGGGGKAFTWPQPGGGGGGGGSGFATIQEITPGQTYSAVIGSGGTGWQTNGTAATAGGSSSLGSITANGGNPGGSASQYSGGAGGSGGSNGGAGGYSSGASASGGTNGTPGSGVDINDFAATTPQPTGTQVRGRAGSLYNGGNGGIRDAYGSSMTASSNTGGGGGGSGRANEAGGNGGSGIIYILRWS